ncbi:MAG: hypothetical protein HKN91_00325 [Acidimicrobiia bacterium]|nr:hypothetical protein [Acidimicrobiia bacterium]
MDLESDLPQDYEQIPWSHLVPPQKDRSLQLAAIAVAAIAVSMAIVFLMRRGPSLAPIVASTTAAPSVVEAPLLDVPVVVSPASTTTLPAGPRIYSEADLMAVLPPPESDHRLEAIARAEWFVTDYFTVDGDTSLADGVHAVLPDVVDLPTTDGSAISYVEWARAVEVFDHRDGSFDVTVWFRTLVGDVEDGFSRTAVRAVDVKLVTDERGKLALADVPVAASVETAGVGASWPANSEPSADTLEEAQRLAQAFGTDTQLQSAGQTSEGWRFVFSVGDASGLRFPIAIHIAP